MHKTGSTYLQGLISTNRHVLKSNGISCRIDSGKPDVRRFSAQRRSAERQEKPAPDFRPTHLRKTVSSVPSEDHLLLSCESLSSLAAHPAAQETMNSMLTRRFEGVSYLNVIRNPVDYACSQIQERIKNYQQLGYREPDQALARFSFDRLFNAYLNQPYTLHV
jgi:hypothetical protein